MTDADSSEQQASSEQWYRLRHNEPMRNGECRLAGLFRSLAAAEDTRAKFPDAASWTSVVVVPPFMLTEEQMRDAAFADRVRNDVSPCTPNMLALRRLVRACDRDRESMTPADVRRAAAELGCLAVSKER